MDVVTGCELITSATAGYGSVTSIQEAKKSARSLAKGLALIGVEVIPALLGLAKRGVARYNGREIRVGESATTEKVADDIALGLSKKLDAEEIIRYGAYWNDVADNLLKSKVNNYRQAILNGDITKPTGGKINSRVVTAAIDTSTGDIYYGISGMNNNPTRNATNPKMQAILDNVGRPMTNYPLENCGEFNAINNALNNGVDINSLRVYSIDRVGGNYKAPCINCQNLYGNIVHFTE